jgi:hypothetical protein
VQSGLNQHSLCMFESVCILCQVVCQVCWLLRCLSASAVHAGRLLHPWHSTTAARRSPATVLVAWVLRSVLPWCMALLVMLAAVRGAPASLPHTLQSQHTHTLHSA